MKKGTPTSVGNHIMRNVDDEGAIHVLVDLAMSASPHELVVCFPGGQNVSLKGVLEQFPEAEFWGPFEWEDLPDD